MRAAPNEHRAGLCPVCSAPLASGPDSNGICPACVAAVLLDEDAEVDDSGNSETTGDHLEQGAVAIPGFELLEPIGRGGMGVVYRARQDSPRREVAIKVLSTAGVAISAEARQRFAHEIELAGRLRHPGIVPIYESGLAKGGSLCYYAMELVDGVPLDRFLARDSISPDERLALFEKVCAAVIYAHRQGVIHRDLTPANILVTSQGEPRLLDFGLGKALTPDTPRSPQISLIGSILGSPCTMSPEQAAGRAEDVDTRSDVYSLGAILYHTLTGHWPHDQSGAVVDVLHRIAHDPARPASRFDRRLDRGQVAILQKALAVAPGQRYQSVENLADDVGRWRRREELSVRPLRWWRKTLLWGKRKPLAAAFAGLAGILVATLSIGGPLVALEQSRLRSEIEAREATRHENLVRLLVNADAAPLLSLFHAMEGDLDAMAPMLRERLDDPGRSFASMLRLKAALFASDPSLEAELVHLLKGASDPLEALLLVHVLRDAAPSLIDEFRTALESGELTTKSTYIHYASLANWSPDDATFWEAHMDSVVDAIMIANQQRDGRSIAQLTSAFLPVGEHLKSYLQHLPDSQRTRGSQAILACLIEGEAREIVEAALRSDEAFLTHFDRMISDRTEVLALLTSIYDRERRRYSELPEGGAGRDRLGRVAVAMIRLDRESSAWRQLGFNWPLRELLIDKLPKLGTSPEILHWKLRRTNGANRSEEGLRTGIARCFLQSTPEALSPEMRDNIVERQRLILDGTVPFSEPETAETARQLLEAWGCPP